MPFSFSPEEQAKHGVASDNEPTSPSSSPLNFMSRIQGGSKSIIDIIAYGVLGITSVVAIALGGYYFYLSSAVKIKKNTIAEYETKLGAFPLENMRSLSNRLKFVNQLIKNHPSANGMFRILENSTENKITYGSANLQYDEATKEYTLIVEGKSPDYKSLVQQIDTLKQKPYTTYLSNLTLQTIEPATSGEIDFSLKMVVAIKGVLPEEMLFGAVDTVSADAVSIPQIVQASTTQQQIPLQMLPTTGASSTTATTSLPNMPVAPKVPKP